MIDYRILVQARMSSSRFPGKMLAPLLGRPLVAHVLGRLAECVPPERVLLVTSEDPSDEPLADYVTKRLGVAVFRGPLDDVVMRFQAALRQHPAEWFVRICGDSPAIDAGLLGWMLARTGEGMDVMSNVVQRTFPPGQSIEIVRSSPFLAIDSSALAADEREHLTLGMYRRPGEFRIVAVEATVSGLAERRHVVDTLEDLQNMTKILSNSPQATRGFDAVARLAGDVR